MNYSQQVGVHLILIRKQKVMQLNLNAQTKPVGWLYVSCTLQT